MTRELSVRLGSLTAFLTEETDVHVMTTFLRMMVQSARVALASAVMIAVAAGTALAQDGPNQGDLSFSLGVDLLPGTAYVFRGVVQEADPKLTLWPYGEVGVALFEGDGSLSSAGVTVGVWNSLHTGSSGSDEQNGGPGRAHYELDFYTGLSLGFSRGWGFDASYIAYTSPNGLFDTVNELDFGLSYDHMLAPYLTLAFELDDEGQADGGEQAGSYLELGVGPTFPLLETGLEVEVPVRLGMSLSNYYENPATGDDDKFGFLSIGAAISVPLPRVPSRYGSWDFHASGDVLFLGETTEIINDGDNVQGVMVIGIGISY